MDAQFFNFLRELEVFHQARYSRQYRKKVVESLVETRLRFTHNQFDGVARSAQALQIDNVPSPSTLKKELSDFLKRNVVLGIHPLTFRPRKHSEVHV